MSLLSTFGQFLTGIDNVLTINVPWIGLIWGICLLVIINAIVQVAINTTKQDISKIKIIAYTLGTLLLTLIVGTVGYYLFYFSFINSLFRGIDHFLNYAMNIIPFSFILFWIALPALAMYLFFSARGLTYYYQKKQAYYSWKNDNKQKATMPSLDSIVEDVEIKRAPDFRKWLKDVNENKVVAVNVDDYYFIPVTSKYQQTHVDSITGSAAAQGSVLVGQSKGNFEAVTANEAIIKIRSLLRKGDH